MEREVKCFSIKKKLLIELQLLFMCGEYVALKKKKKDSVKQINCWSQTLWVYYPNWREKQVQRGRWKYLLGLNMNEEPLDRLDIQPTPLKYCLSSLTKYKVSPFKNCPSSLGQDNRLTMMAIKKTVIKIHSYKLLLLLFLVNNMQTEECSQLQRQCQLNTN